MISKPKSAEPPELSCLVADEPTWAATSPWDNGYALALDVLEAADPDRHAPATKIEELLRTLEIRVREVALGAEGPRGVAMAGAGVRATILVNTDSPANTRHGRHFTLAHELCHILYDRERARLLTHTSTPWASPAIGQRANAFAAMLPMPPHRAMRPASTALADLRRDVGRLAERLGVSGVALKHHLANVGQITAYERDALLGSGHLPFG